MERITLKHNTPEWLNYRKTGIGGSDAGAILGMNSWKTNVDLWEEKVGIREPADISDNPFVQYGKQAEDHIRALFALDYKDKYFVGSPKDIVYRKGCMFASLDGELVRISDGKEGILEIKTVGAMSGSTREQWKGRIPDNYFCQVLHYLAVTEKDFAVVRARFRVVHEDGSVSSREEDYEIERADVEDDIRFLVKEEEAFWEAVTKKVKPHLRLPNI
jgi:putative phage-type endonuclease